MGLFLRCGLLRSTIDLPGRGDYIQAETTLYSSFALSCNGMGGSRERSDDMSAPGPCVVVVGEALIDVVLDSGLRLEAPGGSPLNVAVTLGRLGSHVEFLTAIGNDSHGSQLVEHLSAAGVLLTPGNRILDATSSAVANLEPDGSASYEFSVTWTLGDRRPGRAQVIHAGSLALFVDPGAAAVSEFLTARQPDSLICLDPNIRPSLLDGRDRVRETFRHLVDVADVIKLSDEDASWLYPELAGDEVLSLLLDAGVRLACLTKGQAGATLAHGDLRLDLPAMKTTVSDTIGAGDAYMGALIFQLMRLGLVDDLKSGGTMTRDQLEALGSFASRVASLTVERQGADPPTLEEVERHHMRLR